LKLDKKREAEKCYEKANKLRQWLFKIIQLHNWKRIRCYYYSKSSQSKSGWYCKNQNDWYY
jgi:hypothetical protein